LRPKRIGNCKEGIATLLTNENLPKDLSEYQDNLKIPKDKGGLKKVSSNFFF
jgi:23S rRNA A2030 N6-methylase RlmJ